MTKEFEDYKKKITTEYEKKFLSPQLGEGKVKENLLEGLVSTLNNFSISKEEKTKSENSQKVDYSHLQEKIDMNKLYNLEFKKGLNGSAKRIENIFMAAEFENILEMVEFVYIHGDAKKEYGTWKMYDGKELYKKVLVNTLRQLGNKTSDLLMDYLESENFNFSKEYAEKVMVSIGRDK